MFKNHPTGLRVLFFSEMWERFGYYLMLGIFVLYMTDRETGGLALDTARANEIYGTFLAFVYLTPFAGGLLADQFLGYRKSVVIGGLLMAAGYFGVGLLPGMTAFYASLALVIVGNGFFKPNMSTIVGRLYEQDSPLRDAGYNIFYMGINVGAFICNFVAAILRNRFGWGWAFVAAGVGMLVGVAVFVWGQKHLAHVNDRGDASAIQPGTLKRVAIEVFLPATVAFGFGYWIAGRVDLGSFLTPITTAFLASVAVVVAYYVALLIRAPREERGPIGALLAIFLVVVVFWAVFHQNGNTLTLWARDHTHRQAGVVAPALELLGMDEPAPDSYWANAPDERPAGDAPVALFSTELFQSINPFFVVTLTPILVLYFAYQRSRGREPSTPAKIAWGLAITAASCLVMVAAVAVAHGGKVSPLWLITTYGVITVGELCLSPMGLALVSKLAPPRVTALMMGGWFLATAVGNKLAGMIGGLWDRIPLIGIFLINFVAALLAAVAIALMVPWIRRVMHEHAGRASRKAG